MTSTLLLLATLIGNPALAVCPEPALATVTCGDSISDKLDPGTWTGNNPPTGYCDLGFDALDNSIGSSSCGPDSPSFCPTLAAFAGWSCTAGPQYTCGTPAFGEGPEHVYEIVCPQDGSFELSLTADCDLDLYVLTAACNPSSCLYGSTNGGLTAEGGVISCTPGVGYNIVIEGYGFTAGGFQDGAAAYCQTAAATTEGDYTLDVTCVPDASAEICDAAGDEDGDGDEDCADSDCFGEAYCCDDDGDGFIDGLCGGGDCDDTVFDLPSADADGDVIVDACDNCPADPNTFQTDADGDGSGDACDVCPGVDDNGDGDGDGSICALDCDDDDAERFPGNTEICDTVDNDCDTDVDEGVVYVDYYPDLDGDGFGELGSTPTNSCGAPPANTSTEATDCDDSAATTFPGATELCDGEDNDCDGTPDDGVVNIDYWPDDDGDGFGDLLATPTNTCSAAPPGSVTDGSDCNDNANTTYPGATELSDGQDNDCDGVVDDTTDRFDDDFDGVTELGGDCNDADATIVPGAIETCDGVDQDCDGVIDNGTPCGDDDQDGYCEGPTCATGLPGDCNDGLASVNPGATEVQGNGLDDDCDGETDGLDPDPDGDGVTIAAGDCAPGDASIHPGANEEPDGIDNDCDGVVDNDTPSVDDDGDGASEIGGDCNDTDAAIGPAATETANGIDDDCDGDIDEGTDAGDDDDDGFTENGGDCDDSNPNITPGATETENGIDDDCDGAIDEGLADRDGDGYTTDDCDDGDGFVNPGIPEICDLIDNNCNGEVDEGCGEDTDVAPLDTSKCSHVSGSFGAFPLLAWLALARRR